MATPFCLVSGAWDFANFGSTQFGFTDSGGAHTVAAFSSGAYEHGTSAAGGYCTRAGCSGISQFGTALQTAMQAVAGGGRTITVSWSAGKYTIAIDSGTFSLTFSTFGAAGTLARKLLGFSGDKSGNTSYTSDLFPWFTIKPSIAGLTNYVPVHRQSGSIKSVTTQSGTIYRLAPASIPRLAQWEHHFEPKERVDRDYHNTVASATSTHLYDWEQLWDDYALATMPIGMRVDDALGNWELMAFALEKPEYDDSVVRRREAKDDQRFIVQVQAHLWPTSGSSAYARYFNA